MRGGMIMEQYYTIKEAASLLKLSEGTIRNKISQGEIKAVKILSTTKIAEKELKKLIKPM